MNEFLQTVLTFPTIIYSALLAVVMAYWLLAASGLLDMDGVEHFLLGDGDIGDATIAAGVLNKLGLNGVPMMLVLSVLVFFAWSFTCLAQLLLLRHFPDGMRVLLGAGVLLVALVPGAMIASLLLRPLQRLIVKLRPPVPPSVLGKSGQVISPHVDAAQGRAAFDDGGAGLILQVRAAQATRFERGDRVVLIEHLPDAHAYRVISESEFQRL